MLIVRVEEPEVVTELGLKLPFAPWGRPPTLKLTLPVNPAEGTTLTV